MDNGIKSAASAGYPPQGIGPCRERCPSGFSFSHFNLRHYPDLVPVDGSGRDRIVDASPFYTRARIPPNTYAGQSDTTETVAVNALWLGRTDIDQNLVYSIVKAFWSNKYAAQILNEGHPKGRSISLASAFDGVTIPLCEGAQTFYKEIGVIK